MTTRPDLEGLLARAMRSEAEAAMRMTDTEQQLDEIGQRWEQESAGRKRRNVILAAACVVAVAVAIGFGMRQSSEPPNPPAQDDNRPATLNIDEVDGPEVPVDTRAVPPAEAPVVVSGIGTVGGMGRDSAGRVWLVTGQGNLEWSLDRLSLDGSEIELRVPFVATDSPPATYVDGVIVLAIDRGGPLPATRDFGDRQDGLLRVDETTGQVLGFTPVEQVWDIDSAGDGTVWAVSPDKVVQVDPRTGNILNSLHPPALVNQLEVVDDTLWLYYARAEPGRAYRIDARSGELVQTIDAAAFSADVRVAGGVVLVYDSGRLVRWEADGKAHARELQLPAAFHVISDVVGSDADYLWLMVGDALLQIDGRTLALDGAVTLPWPGPYRVIRDGDSLLVSDEESGSIRRIPSSAFGSG